MVPALFRTRLLAARLPLMSLPSQHKMDVSKDRLLIESILNALEVIGSPTSVCLVESFEADE